MRGRLPGVASRLTETPSRSVPLRTGVLGHQLWPEKAEAPASDSPRASRPAPPERSPAPRFTTFAAFPSFRSSDLRRGPAQGRSPPRSRGAPRRGFALFRSRGAGAEREVAAGTSSVAAVAAAAAAAAGEAVGSWPAPPGDPGGWGPGRYRQCWRPSACKKRQLGLRPW